MSSILLKHRTPVYLMSDEQLPLVSVLFITYKRFDLLERTFHSFRANTSYPNLELVIADDGSGTEIQEQIRTLPADIFAFLSEDLGLGANNNNGLCHCSGKYVLMIQDDWPCQGPPDYLSNAVAVLEANPNVGFINFAGAPHPPDYSQRLKGSDVPCYVTPKPFDCPNREEFLYCDQPHLQSREAIDFIGPYKEDPELEECEADYNRRWRDQTRFATAVFPDYYMRTFINAGIDRSFRTSRFRYKVAATLQPLKPALLRISPTLFRRAKASIQWTLRQMERVRLVR